MPKVLCVTPTYTHPQHQGNSARIFAFNKELQKRAIEVHVLHCVMEWGGQQSDANMRAEWDGFFKVPAAPTRRQSMATCWGIDDWCPDTLCDAVASVQASNEYDAVIINYVWLSKAFEGAGNALRILDTHDLFGSRHKVAYESGLTPHWFFTTDAQEAVGFDRADVVIAIQDNEAVTIRQRTRKPVQLVSYLVPARYLTGLPQRRPWARFGYIGSANPMNQASASALDQAVAQRPLDWMVAGLISQINIKWKSDPLVMGAVEDVGEFYTHIECALNPMLEGTGLKIKTVEALSYGRPVIGTTAAFEGLSPEHVAHTCSSAADVVDVSHEYLRSKKFSDEVNRAGKEIFAEYSANVNVQFDELCRLIKENSFCGSWMPTRALT